MCKREHAFRILNSSLTQPSPSIPQSIRVSINTYCSVVSSGRCSGVYHMIWQPFSQAGSSTGCNFLVICDWVGKRLILGVSHAGIAPCGALLFAVRGTWDVALASQADIPQGMWMLLRSPTLKTLFCNTFRHAPRSLSHTPSVLPVLAAPEAAGLWQELRAAPRHWDCGMSGRQPPPAACAASLGPGQKPHTAVPPRLCKGSGLLTGRGGEGGLGCAAPLACARAPPRFSAPGPCSGRLPAAASPKRGRPPGSLPGLLAPAGSGPPANYAGRGLVCCVLLCGVFFPFPAPRHFPTWIFLLPSWFTSGVWWEPRRQPQLGGAGRSRCAAQPGKRAAPPARQELQFPADIGSLRRLHEARQPPSSACPCSARRGGHRRGARRPLLPPPQSFIHFLLPVMRPAMLGWRCCCWERRLLGTRTRGCFYFRVNF